MMCLGVGLFAPFLFGTLCFLDLPVYFLHQIRKFSFSIFSNRFPISCSSSSPSSTPMMWMVDCLKLSQRLLILSSYFGFLFLLVVLIGCFLLPYVPNYWFNSRRHPLYCCFSVNCSLFQLVYPSFLTGPFYAVEVLTKFFEHPYNQCFELRIW